MSRPLRVLLLCLAAVACGTPTDSGAGGDDPLGPGDDTPKARVAGLDSIAIPGASSSRAIIPTEVWFTNTGIYLALPESDGQKTTILRRHATGFSTASLGTVATMRPVSDNEAPTEVSLYWVGEGWGMLNMNTSTPSFTYSDVPPHTIIPDRTPLAWTWGVRGDLGVVRRGPEGKWELVVKPQEGLSFPYHIKGVSTPAGRLYFGNGTNFYIVSNHIEVRWDLSQSLGSGPINKVVEANGFIWIGYGSHVLKLDPATNVILPFAALSNRAGTISSSFCVNGGVVYMADGRKQAINATTATSWLRTDGSLTTAEQTRLLLLEAILGAGSHFDCHPGNALQPSLYIATGSRLYVAQTF